MAIEAVSAKLSNGDSESNSENGLSTEPLLRNGYRSTTEEGSKQPWMAYLSACVAVCGSYEIGAWLSYSAPTETSIKEDLGLTTAQYAVFGSILSVGAMIGAVTSGPIGDFIGRIWAMRVFSVICAVGWLPIYFAQGAVALDFGRLAGGYGMGAFSYLVPVYIGEIAPVNLRGAMATLHQLLVCTGVASSFVFGLFLTWRPLALVGIIPCGIVMLGLFIAPESPRWLAKKGAREEFKVALQKLRGEETDISSEANEIQEHIDELHDLPRVRFIDMFQKRYLRPLIIGSGLMACRQLSGINGVCFYITEIFESAGISTTVGSLTYVFLQIIVTAISAALMDRVGRKPLLLVSIIGLIIGSTVAAIGFYLKIHNEDLGQAASVIALTGVMVYIAAYSTGLGSVPWVILSEIFPINVKAQAGSLATLVNWFSAWVITYTFTFLMSWSSYGTFILYGAFNLVAAAFIILVVPETKRRTLEQIQAIMI